MSDFQTLQAVDGLAALSAIRKDRFDLIILDINMPKLDGLGLLEKIRNDGIELPALMLSARGDKTDISTGLKLGADDYMTKPFSIEELVLRVKAILRRTSGSTSAKNNLNCGPISMDLDRHQVKLNDELVEMSPTEFKLLGELILRSGKVVSKEVLLANIWEIDFDTTSTVVDTYISYLRKKLHKDGFEGIKTVRGVGFQIVEK
jgi:two-component system OmpR family response regulator